MSTITFQFVLYTNGKHSPENANTEYVRIMVLKF